MGMGRRSSVYDVLSTFSSKGRRASVPSGRRLHILGKSNRKPTPFLNIKIGTQTVPRSLVLSFYSILRGSPIVVGALYDAIQKPKRLNPSTSWQHSHQCWRFEQLPTSGCAITTSSHSLQYCGLAKRGYNSAVSSCELQGSRSRKQPTKPSGEPVDTEDDRCAHLFRVCSCGLLSLMRLV
jgi:hypothetical protein